MLRFLRMERKVDEKIILEVKNLTKYYGKTRGVENLSLQLREGETFGIIGPNGAGKSTSIRAIMNLINKTSGEILIDGKAFDKDDLNTKVKIGYLPSEIHLYDDLTVKQMLDYHEGFYKKQLHVRRRELVERFELDETKKIEDLSFGNLKKVGFILAVMHEPKLLILDEPTSGLDPIMQNVFFEVLREEKAKGTTCLYSTHILSEVSKICDRVGIIKDGHLIQVEEIEELFGKNLGFVTLESLDSEKILKDLQVENISTDEKIIKFANPFPHDALIKRLAKYEIKRIQIQEMSLEDLFLHYYK